MTNGEPIKRLNPRVRVEEALKSTLEIELAKAAAAIPEGTGVEYFSRGIWFSKSGNGAPPFSRNPVFSRQGNIGDRIPDNEFLERALEDDVTFAKFSERLTQMIKIKNMREIGRQ